MQYVIFNNFTYDALSREVRILSHLDVSGWFVQ